jgi:predicted ArsR family transcriptional regulator
MRQWTFITHHAAVLLLMARRIQITARELASEVGITERSVRMIIRDLEAEGYISKIRKGRLVHYTINHRLPLRHRTQQDKAVGELLATLGGLPLRKKVSTRKVSS